MKGGSAAYHAPTRQRDQCADRESARRYHMAHQYLNDGEEEEARARPANEPERHDAPHEDVPVEETSSAVDEIKTTPVTPRRSRRAKSGDTAEAAGSSADTERDQVILPS